MDIDEKPKTPTKKANTKKATPKKKAPSKSSTPARPKRQRKKSTVLREAEESSVPLSPGLESCKGVLNSIQTHRFGFPFLEPVDPVKLNIPDYFDVIKNPMDFGTVKKKLLSGKYETVADFTADSNLVFSNACMYNHPGTDVYIMAETLRDFFKKKMKPIEDRERRSKNKEDGSIQELKKSVTSIQAELTQLKESSTKTPTPTPSPIIDKSSVPMTKSEMRKLSATINSLSYKHLNTIIKIIQESMPNLAGEGELEIDLNSLDNATLRKLETFVESVKKKKSSRRKSQVSIESQRELARRSQEGTAMEIMAVEKKIEQLRDPNFKARNPQPTSPVAASPGVVTSPASVEVEEETVQVEDSSDSESSGSGSESSGSSSGSESESDTESEAEDKPKL